jgi:23S rRNA pseudouridine1911/1915/1917 synthase
MPSDSHHHSVNLIDPLGPLSILRDDPPILVLNKPCGLATQAPPGFDSVVVRVKAYLKQLMGKPGNVYLGVPHRLDRPVSGVILVTRNSKAARRMAEQFKDRQVSKIYVALVEGRICPPAGSLVHWLVKEKNSTKAHIVDRFRPGAQECLLRYETIGQTSAGTLLRIQLGTGRYHQIRAQLAAVGCPIRGDVVYGGQHAWPMDQETNMGFSRENPIALHARQLTFFHPIRYDLVSVSAPLPQEWPREWEALLNTETNPLGS